MLRIIRALLLVKMHPMDYEKKLLYCITVVQGLGCKGLLFWRGGLAGPMKKKLKRPINDYSELLLHVYCLLSKGVRPLCNHMYMLDLLCSMVLCRFAYLMLPISCVLLWAYLYSRSSIFWFYLLVIVCWPFTICRWLLCIFLSFVLCVCALKPLVRYLLLHVPLYCLICSLAVTVALSLLPFEPPVSPLFEPCYVSLSCFPLLLKKEREYINTAFTRMWLCWEYRGECASVQMVLMEKPLWHELVHVPTVTDFLLPSHTKKPQIYETDKLIQWKVL